MTQEVATVLVFMVIGFTIFSTVIVYQIIERTTAISDILKRVWEPKEKE